jgi:four helix bundle protein
VNLAEGVGRVSAADRRRHYAIARGSAMECAALLDACRLLELADPVVLATGRLLPTRIVRVLNGLCS